MIACTAVLFGQGRRSGHFLVQVAALLIQHCAMLGMLWSAHPFWFMAATQSIVLITDACAILWARRAFSVRPGRPVVPPEAAKTETDDVARRQRLARELHDSVGNNLTIISLYARMGRKMAADHQLARIDETAQETMHHVGRILHDLRTGQRLHEEDEPGLAEAVTQVVDEVRDFVPTVDVRIDGGGPIRSTARIVACRVIREALVNGAKHGALRAACVRVNVDDDLRVTVTTRSARSRRRPVAPPMSLGFGLRGLAEEVDALDGEMRSGPKDDGHFEVAVRIPLRWACRTGTSLSA